MASRLTEKSSNIEEASSVNEQEKSQTTDHEIRQDRGLTAWLQVFACWLLFMNTWSASARLLSDSLSPSRYRSTRPPACSPSPRQSLINTVQGPHKLLRHLRNLLHAHKIRDPQPVIYILDWLPSTLSHALHWRVCGLVPRRRTREECGLRGYPV